ncbi:MAG: glycosyltransferase family A protein [Flavisolibacter sp.]
MINQTYYPIEILVIDDGSTDNTEETVRSFKQVQYLFQENKGLSAARNTGIANANGQFIAFLDADDWLYPEGIMINYQKMLEFPNAAFVSGCHDKVTTEGNFMTEEKSAVRNDHYINLLLGNYIGMPAAVMYKGEIAKQFLFDTSLKACEDYDQYLRIARTFEVVDHLGKIAAYRQHNENMSSNDCMMLDWVLFVLDKQKKYLKTQKEKLAYLQGRRVWEDYYGKIILNKARSKGIKPDFSSLLRHNKLTYFKMTIMDRMRIIFNKFK